MQKHRPGVRLLACDPFGRSDPDSVIGSGDVNVIAIVLMRYVPNITGIVIITFFMVGQHWIGIADMIKLS